MVKRIPIKVARQIAKEYKCRQVIIIAWDGELTHCITYGKSLEDCDQAACGGNKIKTALGWPESLHSEPSRVKKLKERIVELENFLSSFKGLADDNNLPDDEFQLKYNKP